MFHLGQQIVSSSLYGGGMHRVYLMIHVLVFISCDLVQPAPELSKVCIVSSTLLCPADCGCGAVAGTEVAVELALGPTGWWPWVQVTAWTAPSGVLSSFLNMPSCSENCATSPSSHCAASLSHLLPIFLASLCSSTQSTARFYWEISYKQISVSFS